MEKGAEEEGPPPEVELMKVGGGVGEVHRVLKGEGEGKGEVLGGIRGGPAGNERSGGAWGSHAVLWLYRAGNAMRWRRC